MPKTVTYTAGRGRKSKKRVHFPAQDCKAELIPTGQHRSGTKAKEQHICAASSAGRSSAGTERQRKAPIHQKKHHELFSPRQIRAGAFKGSTESGSLSVLCLPLDARRWSFPARAAAPANAGTGRASVQAAVAFPDSFAYLFLIYFSTWSKLIASLQSGASKSWSCSRLTIPFQEDFSPVRSSLRAMNAPKPPVPNVFKQYWRKRIKNTTGQKTKRLHKAEQIHPLQHSTAQELSKPPNLVSPAGFQR